MCVTKQCLSRRLCGLIVRVRVVPRRTVVGNIDQCLSRVSAFDVFRIGLEFLSWLNTSTGKVKVPQRKEELWFPALYFICGRFLLQVTGHRSQVTGYRSQKDISVGTCNRSTVARHKHDSDPDVVPNSGLTEVT